MTLRVVKVGGNLFGKPGFARRVIQSLHDQAPCKTAIVVGGGELVDVLRAWDKRFGFDSVQLHWMCVDLLHHTWQLAATLLPELKPIGDAGSLQRWLESDAANLAPALVAVDSFYRRDEQCLPCDWSTTSDSLAALLAQQLQADELILLKSCDMPAGMSWYEAAQRGIVDQAFPEIVQGINRVTIINLLG